MLDEVDLPAAGWLSVEKPWSMDPLPGARITAGDGERWFEARGVRIRHEVPALEIGSHALGTIFGLGAGIDILESVGIATVERHNAALQRVLRAELRGRGFHPNAPDDPQRGAGICVFPVLGHAPSLARELAGNGMVVSARGGGLRIATHVFNSEDDIRQLVGALDAAGIRPAT
jgi:selenocysteine lyase/cysteine desulfurase